MKSTAQNFSSAPLSRNTTIRAPLDLLITFESIAEQSHVEWRARWQKMSRKSSASVEDREVASISDVNKNFRFFTPQPMSAFGTDLYYKILVSYLTPFAFPWPPNPPDVDIISGGLPGGGEVGGSRRVTEVAQVFIPEECYLSHRHIFTSGACCMHVWLPPLSLIGGARYKQKKYGTGWPWCSRKRFCKVFICCTSL